MNLANMTELVTGTLDAYLSQNGGPMKLTNECIRHCYTFQDLMGSNDIKVYGGTSIHFDAMLKVSGMHRFVAPLQVREPKLTDHTRRGTVPWSFSEFDVTVADEEVALNDGKGKLFDLHETRLEAGHTDAGNNFEDTWLDPLGNFDHIGEENAPFWGLKAWATRDGLALDGSASVAGISTTTHPRWLSRYAGPLGHNLNSTAGLDHETAETFTSGTQIRKWAERAYRYARFRSPNNTKFAQDDMKGSAARDHKIYADTIGYESFKRTQDAMAHGLDKLVPAELTKPDPTYAGIPITFVEGLGLGAGGIPTGADHASRGSTTLTAAEYANTGEVFFINTSNFKVFMKEGWGPKKMPTKFIDLQQCLWTLFKWMMGTVCNSRQRQVCLWGFTPIA